MPILPITIPDPTASSGQKFLEEVLVATQGDITLSGEQTIDGVLTSSSRVLVHLQTDQTENGVYISNAGAWSRAPDADTGLELHLASVFVTDGIVDTGSEYTNNNDTVPNLGVTSITYAQTGILSKPDGLFFIAKEEDFPTQDSTTITLESERIYVITKSFSTDKYFVVENGASMTAHSQLGITITYTGTGSMFTGTDVNFTIADIQLDCPTAEVFTFDDVAVLNSHVLFVRNTDVVSCAKYATLTSLASFVICDCASFDQDDGISVIGTGWRVWRIQNSGFFTTSATSIAIDLGTATGNVVIMGPTLFSGPTGSVGLSGLTNSGNVTVDNLARFTGANFLSDITPLSGIDPQTDIRWFFQLNDQIEDTMADALVSMTGNTTETVIAAANTPVKVAGTFSVDRESLFDADTTGRVTYLAERPVTVPIIASLNVKMASGSNKEVGVCFFKNGVAVANSCIGTTAKPSESGNITVVWQDRLVTNDYYEVFVENRDDTVNIVVEDIKIAVN